jgi:hypothetical protein
MGAALSGPQAQAWARWAGVLYLIIIIIGLPGEALARGALAAPGDPCLVGEGAFCRYLLVKGLDVAAWDRRAGS